MRSIRRNNAKSLGVVFVLSLLFLLIVPQLLTAQSIYYPGKWGEWERKSPEEVGMDPDILNEAVRLAIENEYTGSKDLAHQIAISFANEPYNSIVGPTKDRGSQNGIVVKDGYIVAEWGDTKRVDMTFSVTKSYLSTVAGLALDKGLVRDVHDYVKDYVRDGKFDSEHNSKITWEHLLNQSSDWSGVLWDKPDWADRPGRGNPSTWKDREMFEPGTHYKYNDVRVNLLAYSLLMVMREPLPEILREEIMDPIGSSPTWRWHGYKNSWVTIDGQNIQSVSGGGHWGGGFFICTRDHARFGYLFLRKGNWKGEQLISENWIDMLRQPSEANPSYGYMWWLNTGKRRLPDATESAFYAAGFGGNYIYVDQENDLLVVVRWCPAVNDVVKKVLESIK
ncbi:MAG: serine hydrolase [bacterium]|nr:serine hydrolase [bacterium]